MDQTNASIVEEVLAKTSFCTYTKTAKLETMSVKDAVLYGIIGKDLTVNTLEGPVKATPDALICKGSAGELWPQKQAQVSKNYVPTGMQNCITSGGGIWDVHIPDQNRFIFAAKVDFKDSFEVQAQWGKLTGKKGDYLVAEHQSGSPNYDNMWIVNGKIFETTYKARASKGCCGGACHSK